ncbi:MAG: hypothetical protein K6F84_03980 [Lachnospiraceae bacterium]|nr:hypothetical protein [Lachnospiraceae bacterium]
MNQSDLIRNAHMPDANLAKKGYIRWWHSFVGINESTGESRTFFIEYFILNPANGKDIPVLAQHPYYRKKNMSSSYVQIKAGVFADREHEGLLINNYYPVSALHAASDPLFFQVEDCICSETRIMGSVCATEQEASKRYLMTEAGSMSWDVELHKAVSFHAGWACSRLATALGVLDSFFHGEGIKTFFRGSVTLNGEDYTVSPEFGSGYCDKHWGRGYNKPWILIAGTEMYSVTRGGKLRHTAICINGCCPKFLRFPLKRKIMMQLTYMGEDFEFNFTKPSLRSRIKWKFKKSDKRFVWNFVGENKNSVVKVSFGLRNRDLTKITYESAGVNEELMDVNASCSAKGRVLLYRKTPEGLKPVDTLEIDNALTVFS